MPGKRISDAQEILDFLRRLGQCYRHAGVVYLVGGSSLILVAAKESTFDIDLKIEVAPEHHDEFIRCVRRLSAEMELSIEQASPDEFLPLPAGYEDRRRYVGRYAALDVFHFDFYSVALGKLQRGNEKDYNDVVSMIRAGVIELGNLEQYFREVLPKLEAYSLRTDPQDFERKFALFKTRLSSDA
ncbi:MAG: hypothetical protein HY023_00830 [Chloroflexi bacterium]|nr:hypothetical protein [Chloroflexota bacterium]MBI3760408.1 hypothetical protein [Chloroflexota bacterium]